MEYEIESFEAESGMLSSAPVKIAKKFQSISQKRTKDGWKLHSFNQLSREQIIYVTAVWEKG